MKCILFPRWRYVGMKILRFILVACLLLIGANTAFADGAVDPKATMGGTGSCTETPFVETSLTQSFTGLQTGCINDFTNSIFINDGEPVDLTQLVVNITSAFTGTLTCAIAEGSPLTGDPITSTSACTFYAAIESGQTIANGTSYGLEFDNLPGEGPGFGQTVDITLAQTVISTPEPTTMLLLGVGLAGLLAGRKRLKVAGAAGADSV